MQNDLADSVHELRLAVELTGLGIIKIDYDTESVVADARAAELFDLPANKPVARQVMHARFHPDDRIQIHDLVTLAHDPTGSGVFTADQRVVHRDGRVLWLHLRKRVFFNESNGQRRPTTALLAAIDITRRKQVEDEVLQSRQTFQNLVENNPFGVYVVDSSFKMCYASRGARETFGGIEPLLGTDFRRLMERLWPDSFVSQAFDRFQHTLSTGEPYTAPRLVEVRKDRQAIEAYEWMIQRVKMPDEGYGVVCYFYDVSQQNHLEHALRESERRFRELADAAPAMLWTTDENHQCTFLSRSWYELTGQSETEGLGLGWTDAIHPLDKEPAGRDFVAASTVHRYFATEYRLRTLEGDYRWVLDVGQPWYDGLGKFRGYVGSVIDVHERRVVEQDLRVSENRIRLAAETTGFGTYDLDLVTGENVWSDQLFRIMGIAGNAAPNADERRRFVHVDDRHQYDDLVRTASEIDGPRRYSAEYRIVRSGDVRWLLDTGRVLHESTKDGVRPVRVIGTIQDITDRKEFEQSLQDARDRAESANRSRGEFLANMSHEIRTPMAAILGHADILKDHLQDPDNVQIVDTIRRNGKFLLDIINDILDLSKIDAGKLQIESETVRLENLIGDICSLMYVRAAEKNLTLRISCSTSIPEFIQTDAIRLRQILLNLIGNAIKFTMSGEVSVIVSYTQPTLQFSIVDTGIGIRADTLPLLFEPFVQADSSSTRSFGGTGLGLAICKRLAEALGGKIAVTSELGIGSEFTLLLPATIKGPLIRPNLREYMDERQTSPVDSLAATVLVVDDRPDIRYLAEYFIKKAGGQVVTAINGQEAIRLFETPDRPMIDVILMDMQMPVVDGYEATRELRKRGCALPIIALTANAMKSDRDKCLAAGCDDYTTKPLNSKHLIALIDRLVNKRVAQGELPTSVENVPPTT